MLKLKKMKNFLKMLGIALIVLVIEKLSEFLSAVIYGTASLHFGSDCNCPTNNNYSNS